MSAAADPMQVDRDPAHLVHELYAKLTVALALANHDTRTPSGVPKFPGFSHWAVFEGRRSAQRQAMLYEIGRSKPGHIVTNNHHSRHQDGDAADVVWVDTDGKWRWDGPLALWQIWGHCARAAGLTWGGDWHMQDTPHVELP